MINLLGVLTPISLLDSISVIPFAVVVLAVLLGGARPYLGSTTFLLGIGLSYLAAGLLIVLGLGPILDGLSERLTHWWKHPTTLDIVLGIVIGAVMVIFGYRLATARQEKGKQKMEMASEGISPWQAFGLGAGSTLAGLWGALPYFAAIDQILKANLSILEAVLALGYYNLIFILPLAALVVIRAALGARAAGLFDAVNRLFSVWGKRLLIAGLIIVGLVFVADGIGWLVGRPLLPV